MTTLANYGWDALCVYIVGARIARLRTADGRPYGLIPTKQMVIKR